MDGVHDISPQGETDVVVHVEPTASPQETVTDQIHYLAELQGVHAHDIHVRDVNGRLNEYTDGKAHNTENKLDLVLHTTFDPQVPLSQAHIQAEEIKRRLRHKYPHLDSVVIHTEPPES